MKQEEIERMIEYGATSDPDDVTFEYERLKHATDKSVLVAVDGEDLWIPYSQIVEHYPDSNEMCITQWIALKKGLE